MTSAYQPTGLLTRIHVPLILLVNLLGLPENVIAIDLATTKSSVWPVPQQIILGDSVSYLEQTFTIHCATSVCPDPLPSALRRYRELTLVAGMPRAPNTFDAVSALEVHVSESAPLNLGVLEVRKKMAVVFLLNANPIAFTLHRITRSSYLHTE